VICDSCFERWKTAPARSAQPATGEGRDHAWFNRLPSERLRDGWGSLAGDSPTLLAKYPRGQLIYEEMDAYFRDARDAGWHFRGCHNAPLTPPFTGAPFVGRRPMQFAFECDRGRRDSGGRVADQQRRAKPHQARQRRHQHGSSVYERQRHNRRLQK
jgi:hypothetical protein